MKVKTILFIALFVVISVSGCISEAEPKEHIIPQEFIEMINPISATQNSIEKGEKIYQVHCVQCHGPEGRGDGPQAMMFDPRPSNFYDAQVQNNTDGSLFYSISFGVRSAGMPLFNNLFEEDRWHMVNFIRSLEDEEQQD
jgi:mono/diheme cytochrome c family protein